MQNGHLNGSELPLEPSPIMQRFSDIPPSLDIPVSGGEADEAVEVNLEDLLDDPTELCTLLENENVHTRYWSTIALAYIKTGKLDVAIDILTKGLDSVGHSDPSEKLPLYNFLCWIYLLKSRHMPRTRIDGKQDPDAKFKDSYLKLAISTINEASRISPSYSPMFLTRGVLSLLRAALSNVEAEKTETLKSALKSFDDALKASGGRNMMAVLGRARAQFSMGRYADALYGYQKVLEHAPDITDPDPRIGIGCCFWVLGYKDDAQTAWERALEVNPDSKVANALLGLYNLSTSSQYSTTDPKFAPLYKKAMVDYTQKAFKLDNNFPLACATFGNYFLARKSMTHVENLANKAVELTDVSAIASDGWYLLARKEHYNDDLSRANDYYQRADQARGGDDRGYLPAKFGAAQIRVLQGDVDGAKFRLEKMIGSSKNIEAMTLLGTLWADDAFTGRAAASKEDIASAMRRAIPLLENVRMSWKDARKNIEPDPSILLNLARLYELDNPDKSLQCLQQLEQMEMDDLPDDLRPEDLEDEEAIKSALREYISPQLLNNIACFHYQADRLTEAGELFQTALKACVRIGEKDESIDTDALVTTISYNLARTYEAENNLDEAKKVYEGLLVRHSDYIDAKIRLTYIALRQNPAEEGPKAMAQLYEAESSNLEVRSLFGWYLRKAKRRTESIAEDQEQRHYKHTLQGHDKHDRYALTGMGNLWLTAAREIRRDTEQDREKRSKWYMKAVEFFEKALQLDPRNAFAAQGIAIALVEDRKDYSAALQIFSKVRDTIKDANVYVNLGHVYCELKQYSRGIESYEAALAKDRARDPQILACLGRAWLLRGKQEKSVQAMKMSLDFSQRALQAAPDQTYLKFNTAFVQIQIAQLIYSLPETQRTLEEVETAAEGLDQAIESLSEIAKSPNPPFPRHDIEQRASMGRNTMRRQLERAMQSQREYEEKNAARLQQARELREAEMAKRREAQRQVDEAAEERRRQVAEERQKIQERDRQLAELRVEEERRKHDELSTDEETGEKKKRAKREPKKRKKKTVTADSDVDDGIVADGSTPAGSDDERKRSTKKRRLTTKSGRTSSKFKSAEFIVDSDDDDDEPVPDAEDDEVDGSKVKDNDAEDESMDEISGPETRAPAPATGRKKRIIDDEDDDEEEDVETAASLPTNGVNGGATAPSDDDD